MFSREILWMIALDCLQTSRGNLQNMFSGNRCYKIWLLCTCGRNHPKNISAVALQAFSLQLYLKIKTLSGGLLCVKNVEIRAFSDPHFSEYGQNFPVFGEILQFCINTGKYGYDISKCRHRNDYMLANYDSKD